MKKEIRHLVFEIIYVSFILIFLTWFWFGPRQMLLKKEKDIGYQVEGLSSLTITKTPQARRVTLQSDDAKGEFVLLLKQKEQTEKYNTIYYQLVTEQTPSEVRCLSSDGALYLFDIEKKENMKVDLLLWTEDESSILSELTVLPVVNDKKI